MLGQDQRVRLLEIARMQVRGEDVYTLFPEEMSQVKIDITAAFDYADALQQAREEAEDAE